ncbi:hypothetical protein MHU86_21423 [Fragilaria crotonensis]|nr:hypothetical protein MHU86_21423 [Fragilaria crotonensis]
MQHSGLVESSHSKGDALPSDSFRECQGISVSDENLNGDDKTVSFVATDRSTQAMEADESLPSATASAISTAKNAFANAMLASALASVRCRRFPVLVAQSKKAIKKSNKRLKQALSSVSATVDMISSAILSEEDGTADDAGFVTFTSLVATHCALKCFSIRSP